jgi:hypothetical protein
MLEVEKCTQLMYDFYYVKTKMSKIQDSHL